MADESRSAAPSLRDAAEKLVRAWDLIGDARAGNKTEAIRRRGEAIEELRAALAASALQGASAGVGEPGQAVNLVPRAESVRIAPRPSSSAATAQRIPRVVRFDEHTNVTRRRGVRIGWLLWKQDEPPYHYEWRWVQAHVLTWDRRSGRPALKVQFEVKTYRTLGSHSNDGTKRYVRFGVCL